LPGAGETVHWTDQDYTVCLSGVIPASGTVIVHPGARIHFDDGKQIVVRGTIRFEGQPDRR
jgi:hypothetical protein